ncbi:Concanavalin A-like lectin/glucanase domain [Phytophthora cactorum]|nr:Concanavalin A-like lectin/glucanase domain [Phytophthora cactorum]
MELTVLSHVPDKMITSFSADLKKFFDELPENYAIAPTQYLTHVQDYREIAVCTGRAMLVILHHSSICPRPPIANQMKFSAALSAVAIAAATAKMEFCGEQNKTETADYIIYNNLWVRLTTLMAINARGLTVSTVQLSLGIRASVGTELRGKSSRSPTRHSIVNVTSIPSTIEFEFDYKGKLVANVAFDMFTTSILGGNAEYEVMVWLQAIGGAGPLSNTGKPIKEVNVGVYSYVAANTTNSFSTDFKQFFDELPANNTIAPEQYLINVQAGTEPFVGNGTLTVSKYSAASSGSSTTGAVKNFCGQ